MQYWKRSERKASEPDIDGALGRHPKPVIFILICSSRYGNISERNCLLCFKFHFDIQRDTLIYRLSCLLSNLKSSVSYLIIYNFICLGMMPAPISPLKSLYCFYSRSHLFGSSILLYSFLPMTTLSGICCATNGIQMLFLVVVSLLICILTITDLKGRGSWPPWSKCFSCWPVRVF